MTVGQYIEPQIDVQPFLHIQFGEAECLRSNRCLEQGRPQVVMQVDHHIGAEGAHFFYRGPQVSIENHHSVEVRAVGHQFGERLFGEETDVRLREMVAQHAHHGRGEHDVTNGTETDDEDALHDGQM